MQDPAMEKAPDGVAADSTHDAMDTLIAQHDWATTPLGERAKWCQPLQTLVALMLASDQPMFVAWGPRRTWLYNDACRPILGRKHPSALGAPALEVWAEARDTLSPLFDRVAAGEAVHINDIELMLDRCGRLEEAHFTFSYTPVRDASGAVAGLFGVCIDTTAQILAGRREAAAQRRQQKLFEQAPGFIALLSGPQHVFEFVNQAYVALAGHRPLLGLTVREAFPELEDQGFYQRLDEVYRSGRRFVATTLAIHLRGPEDAAPVERHLDFIYEPMLDESGKVSGIFVSGNDVSLAHRASTELRMNQRRHALLVELADRFRDLTEPADLSYAAAELLGRTLGVSRAGYGTIDPATETITIERDWNAPGIRSLAGVLHFRDYGSYIEDLKRGETVVFADAESDPRTRDTAEALKAISAQAVVNMPVTEHQGLVALLYLNHAQAREWSADELALIREVAERTRSAVERRRAENDLIALTASLETQVTERTAERDRVWRNSRDLLAVIGSDGVFRAANPAWERLLGHAPAHVVGRSYRDLVWPEDADATAQALDGAAGREDLIDFENRYRHTDGSPRWISWHTAREGDCVYCYGRDISAQKDQARALQQAEAALRQSQKLEAMGQLTGGVAHDFNNLLAVVSNNVFLHRRLSPICEHSPQLAAISRASDTGAKLTRQLLTFARRQAIRPDVLRLQSELPELSHVLQVSVGSASTLELEIAADAPPIHVDRSEFELALINLAMNARDAMPGGGTLRIEVSRDQLRDGAPSARIDVIDSGHGIPPELVTRVFEPFFSTKEPGRGTGLGLSQVYGFATQAGGEVRIASKAGCSTTVTLLLPASTRDGPAPDIDAPAQAGPIHARVLVVEDNVDVGVVTRELLQYSGCEVLHLTSGDQALDYLKSREAAAVDVVLSDVMMPGNANGVALAHWIRSHRPTLPVLLMSGFSTELGMLADQGYRVLHKPIDANELVDAIRAAVAESRGKA